HEPLEATLAPAALAKPESEVRVHDASPSFSLEPVLTLLREALVERADDGPFRRPAPVVHPRAGGVVVRHPRARGERVHVAEDEVAHVLDPLAADVAPEQRLSGDVAAEAVPVLEAGEQVVDRAAHPRDPVRAEVQVLVAVV